MSQHHDLKRLKALLPEYLGKIGCQPEFRAGGQKLKSLCPLHDDHNPSLAAEQKQEGAWRWYCHPCAQGGTLIDLHLGRTGLSLREAIADLAAFLEVAPVEGAPASLHSSVPQKPKAKERTDGQRGRAAPEPLEERVRDQLIDSVQALLDSPELVQQHAEALGLQPQTLLRLAHQHDLGLIDGKLAHLYHDRQNFYGAHVRNTEGSQPRFFWIHGRPQGPWRLWRAAPPCTETIYFCEGQSDAMALIDAGLKEPSQNLPHGAVLALAGKSLPLEWVEHFRCRDVVICFDGDEPGSEASRCLSELLRPVANSVKGFAWAELRLDFPDVKDLRGLGLALSNRTK